jgi:hypothetical protein
MPKYSKTEKLISEAIDLASHRLKIKEDKFISISIYDCCGSWQAWINLGRSGVNTIPYETISINDAEYSEKETLDDCLKEMIKLLKNKKSTLKATRYL